MTEPVAPPDDGRGHDALDDFLRDLDDYPLLTHAEHLSLIARAQDGDQDAMDAMIAHNLRFVVCWAGRRIGQGLPLPDLIAEGSFGLRRAVQKYRLGSGYQFSTYAAYWIRQAIGRAIETQGAAIRLPSYRYTQLRKIKREYENDYEAREKALQALDWHFDITSLDVELHPHDPYDETTRGDLIPANDSPPSAERIANEQLLVELINRAELTWRELTVVSLRYGLSDGREWTLEEIGARMPWERGKHLGISRERVRQIEAEALQKLRRAATHSQDRDALLALVA